MAVVLDLCLCNSIVNEIRSVFYACNNRLPTLFEESKCLSRGKLPKRERNSWKAHLPRATADDVSS